MPEAHYLSQTDTIMWTVEADPLLRSTILGVALLDGAPEWSRLRARMEEVTHHVPALREKVRPVPLHPTMLRWEPDPTFDLNFHLRHISLPAHSGVSELLDWVRTEAMGGFDLSRPLWEFTLVEGVGRQAAFVMKGHHVVTDGIGAVQLAAHLFDLEQYPPQSQPTDRPVARRPHPVSLLRDVILHDVEGAVDLARHQLNSVIPTLLEATRHPQRAVGELVDTARSIGKVIAPSISPKSHVMVGRVAMSNLRTLEIPVDDMRNAAKQVGGTINDAFLAGIAAGLHRYHVHHDEDIDELRVAMPISLRNEHHDEGGNHITVMRFTLPMGAAPIGERIAAMRSALDGVRHERSLEHTSAIAGFLNLLPKGAIGAILKGVDFLASNVPGVPVPLWLEGRRVLRFYPFGPTAGAALNVTLMSYDGLCCIGVNADAAAIPDPDVLADCLREGFDEVRASSPRAKRP